MKLFTTLLLLPSVFASAIVSAPSEPITYDGYKVVRIDTTGGLQAVKDKLAALSFTHWDLDASRHMDIALPPDQIAAFNSLGLPYSTMHEDLGASIKAESANAQVWEGRADNLTWFNSYHPYADHEKYLQSLQASFPNNSEMVSSGTSYQGRNIFGIHLWGSGGPGKPAVLWHGTVHAREWIAAMVVEYLTLNLITGYPGDTLVKSLLDTYDFYIIPFVNPDGFVYSQSTDRLWRKNRQPSTKSKTCLGRDINRQWPYQWDSNDSGASPDPCDETYRGEAPSDGPESQGVVAFVDKLRDANGIKLYIDWHSYGQHILSPWGWVCDVYPEDSSAHVALAGKVAKAIKAVEGKTFDYGPSCSTLYATTGDSVDYIHGPGKSDWSFTIELRDTGNSGFVLPPAQILGSAKEQWEGMKVMLTSLG